MYLILLQNFLGVKQKKITIIKQQFFISSKLGRLVSVEYSKKLHATPMHMPTITTRPMITEPTSGITAYSGTV